MAAKSAVTVEDVCEFYSKHKLLSIRETVKLFGQHFPAYALPDVDSDSGISLPLYKAMKRVYEQVRRLTKQKNYKSREELLSQPFEFSPALLVKSPGTQLRTCRSQLAAAKTQNLGLKRKITHISESSSKRKTEERKTFEDIYSEQLDHINELSNKLQTSLLEGKTNEDLGRELNLLKADYLSASVKIDKLEKKLKASCLNRRSNQRNACKKIRRRESMLQETLQQNETLRDRIALLTEKEKQLDEAKEKLTEFKSEKLSHLKKISYLRKKCKTHDCEVETSLDSQIKNLQTSVDTLRTENKELHQLINLMDDPELITFIDGKYTDEIRQVIMELLSLNVSMNKVGEVIKVVLSKLAHKNVGRLPSMSLRSKFLVEARYLAKVQVAENMLEACDPTEQLGNCLHFDGASKFHRNYQNWQVTLTDGKTLSLGLHEMSGGDTANVVDSFIESIDELAELLRTENKSITVAQIVASIKSTISDQGSVNPCFNRQLQTLREDLLPIAIEKWDSLSENEKADLAEMGNFFCKLHLLVNFATECDKTLSSFETVALEKNSGNFISSAESGPGRLVRTAVKAFHPRGSEEAGIASHFKAYLDSQNLKLHLIPYVGNRFNVLFYDAAAVYFHRAHIKSFLSAWPNPNKLLLAVQDDIDNKVNLAGIRALGVIDKIVTGPFWRMLQKHHSILDTNPYLEIMRRKLTSWCEDASPLLQGEVLFDETDADLAVHRDEIFDSLLADTGDIEFDMLTQQALELLMHSLLLLLERQAQDQLLQGKYAKPGPELLKRAKNVPTTNAASERDFAILDLLVRMKPSGTILLYESLTMWMNNKTSEWLYSKSPSERVRLMTEARHSVPLALKTFNERKVKIRQRRIESLRAKQQAKEDALIKQREAKLTATNNILPFGGVWCTAADVDRHIANLTVEEGRAAVIAQLNFQKKVLNSKGNKELFFQSHTVQGRRKLYTFQTMVDNLKTVLNLNSTCMSNISTNQSPSDSANQTFRSPGERTTRFTAEKAKLASRLKEARLKRIVASQKEQLPVFEKTPNLLVGCRVQHKCIEEHLDEEAWFCGVVTKIIKRNDTTPLRTVFEIRYDIDSSKWTFPLLVDLKKGDLIVEDN